MRIPIITDELARNTLDRLSAVSPFPRELFQYEIQEDFQLLFISVATDEFSEAEVKTAVQEIAALLHGLMPVRDDDYSWVVGLKRRGVVAESCFGGNAKIPDWDGTRFVDETA